jgi:hypothetical protein
VWRDIGARSRQRSTPTRLERFGIAGAIAGSRTAVHGRPTRGAREREAVDVRFSGPCAAAGVQRGELLHAAPAPLPQRASDRSGYPAAAPIVLGRHSAHRGPGRLTPPQPGGCDGGAGAPGQDADASAWLRGSLRAGPRRGSQVSYRSPMTLTGAPSLTRHNVNPEHW